MEIERGSSVIYLGYFSDLFRIDQRVFLFFLI
jgi:hypothetical protein